MAMRIAEGFFTVVMIAFIFRNGRQVSSVITSAGQNYANLVKGLEGR